MVESTMVELVAFAWCAVAREVASEDERNAKVVSTMEVVWEWVVVKSLGVKDRPRRRGWVGAVLCAKEATVWRRPSSPMSSTIDWRVAS